MKRIDWKKLVPNIIILLVFVVASAIYFWPALEGKIIYAGDNINGTAACHEGNAFKADHPEGSWWCGSMFAGMPNYQLGGHGDYLVDHILRPVRLFLSWGNRNTFFIFLFYLCAFFLLLRSFKIDQWLSMAGAFAISLSSYFFVIIAASHHGKCYSLTWMTLAVVGFILTYRKQYGWGALMTMFFTYVGFFLHPQMSYYVCMMIGIFFFAELAIAIRDKEWKHLGIATAVFAASFGIGMGMGSSAIFTTQEYARETMRGGHSDLTKVEGQRSNAVAVKGQTLSLSKAKGLDLDYATAWSYGRGESMTFLIPNYQGGASGYDLGKDSQLEKDLKKIGVPASQAKGFCKGAPTYWGEKAFTSGPVYMGAIVCFLFLLGLLIVSGPYKWALLVATLFSVFLAWGHNMMWLTELFFQYFPMYNKFRAVESILVVAEITVPLLGFLALKEIGEKRLPWEKLRNRIFIAGGVTALICLYVGLFAGTFDVTSSYDAQWKGQVGNQIYNLILSQRRALMQADAWRSLIFVLLGTAVAFYYALATYKRQQARATMYTGVAMTVLILADMWTVDKRFCNDGNFVSVKDTEKVFKMQAYEQAILEHDTTYFRVFNLTTSPFNDARTSYYFKSIGGYSAAKLRRYQDLIDEHISKMNWNVLNMLNAKYIITQGNNGQPTANLNDQALGNCWIVDELVPVDNANAESDSLRTIDIRHQAVYDRTYAGNEHITDLPAASVLPAYESDTIYLTGEYAPNRLTYLSRAERPRTAVFSEIYYPYGWKATIDGAETSIFRVNYALRAITLPAGEHEIVFSFEPESVAKGNRLSLICFALFLLTLCGVVGWEVVRCRKAKAE